MQTLLPYSSFDESAKVLDANTLGKQRTENFQILKTLLEGLGDPNHPAKEQWRGYEWLLMRYQLSICHEWVARGYDDKVLSKTQKLYQKYCPLISPDLPWWLGDEEYHASQRRKLLRRKWKYYSHYFPEAQELVPLSSRQKQSP